MRLVVIINYLKLHLSFIQMDSKLFLDIQQTKEGCAIETFCVQICIFSSIKCVLQSHWWLNDRLYVSANLLIFVGPTKVECMLKPSESMERKRDHTCYDNSKGYRAG